MRGEGEGEPESGLVKPSENEKGRAETERTTAKTAARDNSLSNVRTYIMYDNVARMNTKSRDYGHDSDSERPPNTFRSFIFEFRSRVRSRIAAAAAAKTFPPPAPEKFDRVDPLRARRTYACTSTHCRSYRKRAEDGREPPLPSVRINR